MASQWQNFLRNLGDWRGSFTSISVSGDQLESTPSILTLENAALDGVGDTVETRLVRFRLRRYADGLDGEPSREVSQDYRSLGRQVVFFESGSFCKGTLQVAPNTASGAEFGFVAGDRRHRLVQLFEASGGFDGLVLIREFRAGSDACERPPLSPDQVEGQWQGRSAVMAADWPEIETRDCWVTITAGGPAGLQLSTRFSPDPTGAADLEPELPGEARLLWLPDGGFSLAPERLSFRARFSVEAGWLVAPNRLERLIRRYDASGAWHSALHQVLEKV